MGGAIVGLEDGGGAGAGGAGGVAGIVAIRTSLFLLKNSKALSPD